VEPAAALHESEPTMNARTLILAAALAPADPLAPPDGRTPPERAEPSDPADGIQGEWVVVACRLNGKDNDDFLG
jgi:hypothetical protein